MTRVVLLSLDRVDSCNIGVSISCRVSKLYRFMLVLQGLVNMSQITEDLAFVSF